MGLSDRDGQVLRELGKVQAAVTERGEQEFLPVDPLAGDDR